MASFHLRKRWTGFSVAAVAMERDGGFVGPQPVRAILPGAAPECDCAGQGRALRCAAPHRRGAGPPVMAGNVTVPVPLA